MGENNIIKELQAWVDLFEQDCPQRDFAVCRLRDAKAVKCVPMAKVFTPYFTEFLRKYYKPIKKQCYKNASILASLASSELGPERVRYVEGFVSSYGISIEHAFVRVDDMYVDATFEWALNEDVQGLDYVSLMELSIKDANRLQVESGFYGELYRYRYMKKLKQDILERKTAPECSKRGSC